MRVDKKIIIAGLPVKTVRDAIREMDRQYTGSDDGWPFSALAGRLNISPTHAEWVCESLIEQAVLERKSPAEWSVKQGDSRTRYTLGEYGTRFIQARMLKRITRAKVDLIIEGLLTRVQTINANPDLCYFVNEIRLFGSAIDGKADSSAMSMSPMILAAGNGQPNTRSGSTGRTSAPN